MNDFDENEIDALEQRMRAKLKPEAPRKGGSLPMKWKSPVSW